MAKNYLITTTEVYRVISESAAQKLIDEAKTDSSYDLVKYNCEHKERKAKGDVIDDWFKVTLFKKFTDEKEPEVMTNIIYEVE
jgi:endo-1,4-beta-D-glucanase Y